MDFDGLEKIIQANHETVLASLKSIDKKVDTKFEDIDKKFLSHDRTLTRVKTIGGLLSVLWATILWYGRIFIR
jgi:hypothetical protein